MGVRDRTANVVRIKPTVEADAFGELFDQGVRRLTERSRPGFFGHDFLAQNRLSLPPKALPIMSDNAFTLNGLERGVNERRTRAPQRRIWPTDEQALRPAPPAKPNVGERPPELPVCCKLPKHDRTCVSPSQKTAKTFLRRQPRKRWAPIASNRRAARSQRCSVIMAA